MGPRPIYCLLLAAALGPLSPGVAWADGALVRFGRPEVKYYAWSIPFGPVDPAEALREDAAGKTDLRTLTEWIDARGAGEGVLLHGTLEDFERAVYSNLLSHYQARAPLKEVVLIIKAHGLPEGVTTYDGRTYSASWAEIARGVEWLRAEMDKIDKTAALVVIVDACYGGRLWYEVRSMHDFAFLSAAPRDRIGLTDFLPHLLRALDSIDPARGYTWYDVFLRMRGYSRWYWDKDDPFSCVWVMSMYGNSTQSWTW